jgi:hypothetical protein
MQRAVCAVMAVAIFMLGISSSAMAFEGGGRSPSEAPTIAIGQHYTGQLNNHKNDSNYGGEYEVAFWRLPPVSTRDVVTIDWHSVPYTDSPGRYPLCMSLMQGIDDFSWGSRFDNYFECDSGGPFYDLSGSGTAHTQITIQESTTDTSYLEFFVSAYKTNADEYESFPYDFTVGPILHYLGLTMSPVEKVAANGVVQATATLANGQPAPDGLTFGLPVTWREGGIASFTGTTSGGVVSFQLNLPETAYGKRAKFVAFHPADSSYQEIVASAQTAQISRPPAPAPSACELAERRALALSRQYKRLRHNARRARGWTKRRLSHRANRVKRRLGATRREVAALCV